MTPGDVIQSCTFEDWNVLTRPDRIPHDIAEEDFIGEGDSGLSLPGVRKYRRRIPDDFPDRVRRLGSLKEVAASYGIAYATAKRWLRKKDMSMRG